MLLILLLLSAAVAYWIVFKQLTGSIKFLLWIGVSYLGLNYFMGNLLNIPLVGLIIVFFALPWLIAKYVYGTSNDTATKLALLTSAGALLIPPILVALGIAAIVGIAVVI